MGSCWVAWSDPTDSVRANPIEMLRDLTSDIFLQAPSSGREPFSFRLLASAYTPRTAARTLFASPLRKVPQGGIPRAAKTKLPKTSQISPVKWYRKVRLSRNGKVLNWLRSARPDRTLIKLTCCDHNICSTSRISAILARVFPRLSLLHTPVNELAELPLQTYHRWDWDMLPYVRALRSVTMRMRHQKTFWRGRQKTSTHVCVTYFYSANRTLGTKITYVTSCTSGVIRFGNPDPAFPICTTHKWWRSVVRCLTASRRVRVGAFRPIFAL